MTIPSPFHRFLLALLFLSLASWSAGEPAPPSAEEPPAEESPAAETPAEGTDPASPAGESAPTGGDDSTPEGDSGAVDEPAAPTPGADSEGDGEGEAPSAEEVSGEDEPTVAIVPPAEALVAIRGDRFAGIGVLVDWNGTPAVVTGVSALDGNTSFGVTLPDGRPLQVEAMAISAERDLVLMRIALVEDLPGFAEWSEPPQGGESAKAFALGPRQAMALKVKSSGLDLWIVEGLENAPYPGSPVVEGEGSSTFYGIFNPQKTDVSISGAAVSATPGYRPARISILEGARDWVPLDWRLFVDERAFLDSFRAQTLACARFLGRTRDLGTEIQPLEAAKRIFKDSISRPNLGSSEKTQIRQRFLFAIQSQVGQNVVRLERGLFDFYPYFQDEAEKLLRERQELLESIRSMRDSPSRVDAFAR